MKLAVVLEVYGEWDLVDTKILCNNICRSHLIQKLREGLGHGGDGQVARLSSLVTLQQVLQTKLTLSTTTTSLSKKKLRTVAKLTSY